MKPVKNSMSALADSKYVFTLSWSCFSPGGRRRNMRMEWNGGSWNTEDPISLLSTNLCQKTSTSITTVGLLEMLTVSDVLVLKQWHHICGVIHNLRVPGRRYLQMSVKPYSQLSLWHSKWMLGHIWLMTVIAFALVWPRQHPTGNCCDLLIPTLVFVFLELWSWMLMLMLLLWTSSFMFLWPPYLISKTVTRTESLMTAHKITGFFFIYYYRNL